jgi:urease accessory protein
MEGFQGGLLHPLLVPAHLLALVALGLLLGQMKVGKSRTALIVAFAAGFVGGIAAVMQAYAPTNPVTVVLACAAVAGALVALARPLPTAISALPVVIAGTAIALDSVPDTISTTTTLLTLFGAALGTTLVLAAVALSSARLTRAWLRTGIRIAGSWIAASAILVLALQLAG